MSFFGNLSRSCQQARKALHVSKDFSQVSPETEICRCIFDLTNPWDFEEVYCSADLPLFAHGVPSYSGTPHPDRNYAKSERSGRSILHIDLNLSRYEKLAERFRCKTKSDMSFLKSGIETRNAAFNAMIAKMEQVGAESMEPILLMVPTGSGKSRLVGQQKKRQVENNTRHRPSRCRRILHLLTAIRRRTNNQKPRICQLCREGCGASF